MIIKYYTRGLSENLHILEECKNITVHQHEFSFSNNGPDDGLSLILEPYTFEQFKDFPVKYISFDKDNERFRLGVLNMAYICNNDGKTIEKVSVSG